MQTFLHGQFLRLSAAMWDADGSISPSDYPRGRPWLSPGDSPVLRLQSWWHASKFFVAELDGAVAATLCALPAGEGAASASNALQEAGAGMDLDMAAVRQRGSYISECWMPGNQEAWLIEHVATRPEHRGRGIALALLGHAVAAGRKSGRTKAQITFLIGNESAERSYLKAGFQLAEEKRGLEFEALTGAPGLRRYERKI